MGHSLAVEQRHRGWLRASSKLGGAGRRLSAFSQDADAAPLLPQDLGGFEAQSSSNLINWTTLNANLTLTNGGLLLIDPQAISNSQRFYRIIER